MLNWAVIAPIWRAFQETFDLDVSGNNRFLSQQSGRLANDWNAGLGRCTDEDAIRALSDIDLDLALGVAREQLRLEYDRRVGLLGRPATVGTIAAVLLALAIGFLQFGFGPSYSGFLQALQAEAFTYSASILRLIPKAFLFLGTASLLASIGWCLLTLEAGHFYLPSFRDLMSSKLGSKAQDPEIPILDSLVMKLRHALNLKMDPGLPELARIDRRWGLRMILYASSQNQVHTLRFINMLEAGTRHLKDGFWCLLVIVFCWIAPSIIHYLAGI